MAIESETQFLWKMLFEVLFWPFSAIMVLIGKRPLSELFKPIENFIKFLFEPKFTITIILINIAIFISQIFMSEKTMMALAQFPSDLFSIKVYTIITAGFLHSGIPHLAGNMTALFIFGRVVERKFGAFKSGLIYFGALIISGVFSALINMALHDNTPGIGASGALMGVVAAAVLLDPFYLTWEIGIPIPIMFLGWLAIYGDIAGVLNPIEDGIGHFAHLGGFLSIALLAYFIGEEDKSKMKLGLLINIISIAVAIGLYLWLA